MRVVTPLSCCAQTQDICRSVAARTARTPQQNASAMIAVGSASVVASRDLFRAGYGDIGAGAKEADVSTRNRQAARPVRHRGGAPPSARAPNAS